jgi:ABC-type oligopeptide transport system substrate-binding subunit
MFHLRRPLRHFRQLLLLVWLGLLFAACAPDEPELIAVTEVVQLGDEQIIITRLVELEPTPTVTPKPPVVQQRPIALDLAYETSLPELDPQRAVGKESFDLIENLFIGLTRYNHETLQIEPQLAERWTVSADGRTWIFSLRDDIQWVKPSDPPPEDDEAWEIEPVRPVVAWDVVRAIERLCTRETGTPEAYNFFIIEGCEVVYSLAEPTEQDLDAIGAEALDATTLQITLTEPASYFLTLTSMPQMRPVPGELIEDHGSSWRTKAGELADGWQTPENIVTNGPFIPSAAVFSDESIALHKNPLWPLNRPGNIDVVNIAYEQNEDDVFEAWGEKTIDLSPLPVDEREAFLAQTPAKARLITNQTSF